MATHERFVEIDHGMHTQMQCYIRFKLIANYIRIKVYLLGATIIICESQYID